MRQKQAMDLTQGAPLRQILLFSLPLVAGTLLQQLYSFVDTAMVGRILGEQALAAVEAKIAGKGRALLRQSGTEPVIRVMIESESETLCREYADSIVQVILKGGHGVEC